MTTQVCDAAEWRGGRAARAGPDEPAGAGGPALEERRAAGQLLGPAGVPVFSNSERGQIERFNYYEARRLSNLPQSLWDSNDVRHGRLTAAEKRALERKPRRTP